MPWWLKGPGGHNHDNGVTLHHAHVAIYPTLSIPCLMMPWCILDFVLQMKTQFTIMTMEQHYIMYMLPYILHCLYRAWWCPGDLRGQGVTIMTMEQHYIMHMLPYILHCQYRVWWCPGVSWILFYRWRPNSQSWQWSNTTSCTCCHISYTVYTVPADALMT